MKKHIFLFLLLNSILAYLKLANVVQSAGTIALLVIINCNALAIATGHLDFSLFVLHSSFKYALHFRKTHYVANVPADLRSAGIEYKDL